MSFLKITVKVGGYGLYDAPSVYVENKQPEFRQEGGCRCYTTTLLSLKAT